MHLLNNVPGLSDHVLLGTIMKSILPSVNVEEVNVNGVRVNVMLIMSVISNIAILLIS